MINHKNYWKLAIALALIFAMSVAVTPASSATPISGAFNAKAGSGGVTAGRFVKLSAAGTVITSAAVTDVTVGVAEITAAADGMTRYAPLGTVAKVTASAAISVGACVGPTTGGKAVTVTEEKYVGVALNAASNDGDSIDVFLLHGYISPTIAGATTSAADSLAIPVTHAVVTKTTGADAEALTLADGNPGQFLTIYLGTDGGGDGTLTPATATGWSTYTFDDAGDLLSLKYIDDTVGWVIMGSWNAGDYVPIPEGSTTSAADSLAIPVTHAIVTKTTGADAEALTLANGTKGQVLTIYLGTDGGGDGTLTPATATGWSTYTFDDAGDLLSLMYIDDTVGWIILGSWNAGDYVPIPEGSTTSAADSLAIPVTHAYVAKTTGGDAEALTLANGTKGQLLTISLVVDGGGDGTLTPTTCSGFATIVFAAAGDTATLLYVDDTIGWIIVGAAGVLAPPAISI